MNFIYKTYWAYRNKITNKLFGVVTMPAHGDKKGYVLISYITEPFTIAPWEKLSNFHSMYWECREIAKLFSKKGYRCDIINAENKTFIPAKSYSVCIGTHIGMDRIIKHLPEECITVMHILISHWSTYNRAEVDRLKDLQNRRGVLLKPRRQVEESKTAEIVDFLEGFGNKNIFGTFEQFNKPIFFIPASNVVEFDFPEKKNFSEAKKHFLWIGGGGAVLKGLDLVLEAFAEEPDLHLHVCGPVHAEKDFVDEYKKELLQTENIHTYGRIDVTGEEFAKILNKCGFVISASAGEGSATSVILAMNAGLIPILSHATGIQEDSKYIPLENPTIDSIRNTVVNASIENDVFVEEKSKETWVYARKKYTQKEFSRVYEEFLENILKI